MSETTPLTLTDFLLARIAEDEVAVNERTRYGAPPGFELLEQFGDFGDDERWMIEIPAGRLLAECEAKQQIVEDYAEMLEKDVAYNEASGRTSLMYGIARRLAAIYADHVDYREEWRL